jgi:hypothetical protein
VGAEGEGVRAGGGRSPVDATTGGVEHHRCRVVGELRRPHDRSRAGDAGRVAVRGAGDDGRDGGRRDRPVGRRASSSTPRCLPRRRRRRRIGRAHRPRSRSRGPGRRGTWATANSAPVGASFATV